jgi:TonB family protein
MLGGVFLALLMILKNVRLRFRLRHATPVSASGEHAVKTDVSFLESEMILCPILIGLFKPRLYLPPQWSGFEEQHLQSIIAHEVAHHESLDTLILLVQYLGLVAFWFNPLVWLAHFRINQIREMRCDEIAVEQTGLSPIEYSKLLVSVVERHQAKAGALVLGRSFSQHKKSLFGRINHILNHREVDMKKKWLYYVAPVLLALFVLPLSWQCSGSRAPLAPDQQVETSSKSSSMTSPTAGSKEELGISTTAPPKYDSPPESLDGFRAIKKELKYPALARLAGIQGKVVLEIHVAGDGNITETKVLRSIGENNGTEEAAINAVKAVKWKPAMLNGQPVATWAALPVVFSLPE